MLKVRSVAKICLPAGVILLIALLVASQPASGMIVEFDTNLPSVPSEMTVLKTVSAGMTRGEALDIASRIFDLNGECKGVEGGWRIWEESREVYVYKSGGINYLDWSKAFEGGYRQDELPSDPECREMAESFLENLRSQGLLQTALQVEFNDVIRDQMVIAYADGTIEDYFMNAHVNYALSFNGTRLSGSGAKLRVYIGSGGEVTGIIKYVPEITEFKTVRILTPEEAIGVFKRGDYGASKATIQSFELVFDVPHPEVETAYIIPVYKLEGTFTLPDGDIVSFGEIVPAVRQSEIEEWGSPRLVR